jgi:hypothetical protein
VDSCDTFQLAMHTHCIKKVKITTVKCDSFLLIQELDLQK